MQRELEAAGKHTVREIPRLQRRALAKSLDYYRGAFNDARTGMAAAYATGDYTLQAIADAFGVHYRRATPIDEADAGPAVQVSGVGVMFLAL
jgi:rRNA maturation endonuclease Nob1